MGLIAFGFLTVLATTLLAYRRRVEERAIRWQLYALRDELRDLAYSDRTLLAKPLFRQLDRNVTLHCATLGDFSLWGFAGGYAMSGKAVRRAVSASVKERQRVLSEELQRPENENIASIYHRSVSLVMRHLVWRHLFITIVSVGTLVGIALGYLSSRWIAERVVSGAFTEAQLRPGGSAERTPVRLALTR